MRFHGESATASDKETAVNDEVGPAKQTTDQHSIVETDTDTAGDEMQNDWAYSRQTSALSKINI